MSEMNGYSSYFYKYVFNNFMFGEPPNGYFYGNKSRYIDVSTATFDFDGAGLTYPSDPSYLAYEDNGDDIFVHTPTGVPLATDTYSRVRNFIPISWPIATVDWNPLWSIMVSHYFYANPGYGNPAGKYPLFGGRLDSPSIVLSGQQLICLSNDLIFIYNW